ncbi:hypothetical protein [Hyphomicrobium sp.]|uniref:hypothetical protein n=1 Tax=Hyphomicrobium sp. TaxID=82 RepID=UPI001DF45D5B|nr:hypothetical protein [Hyphomicrobium sp.]MBY0560054.1 hypothetical protein [Hyphomicrobium sp.]
MKLATYIDQLTTAGIEPKIATAHAKALETMLDDKYVTKDYLDAKLSDVKAVLFQTVGIAGIFLAIMKLTAH